MEIEEGKKEDVPFEPQKLAFKRERFWMKAVSMFYEFETFLK